MHLYAKFYHELIQYFKTITIWNKMFFCLALFIPCLHSLIFLDSSFCLKHGIYFIKLAGYFENWMRAYVQGWTQCSTNKCLIWDEVIFCKYRSTLLVDPVCDEPQIG